LFFGCLLRRRKSAFEMTHPELPLMHRFAELNPSRSYRGPAFSGDFPVTFPWIFQSVHNKFDVNLEQPCSAPVRVSVIQKIIRSSTNTGLTLHPVPFHIGSLDQTTRTPCAIDVTIGHAGLFGRRASTDGMTRNRINPPDTDK
jgi:hypothetical protein